MKVRETIWFSWSVALAAILGQPLQAADGRPSQGTLAAMGLGGMTILSDEDASTIRGFGFNGGKGGSSVAVFGNSFANINTPFGDAHSENGYAAEGTHFAKGANGSHAGVEFKISSSNKGGKRPGGNHGNKLGSKSRNMGPVNGGTKWPGKGGGKHGGGKSVTISVKVFAGGFSFAKAH